MTLGDTQVRKCVSVVLPDHRQFPLIQRVTQTHKHVTTSAFALILGVLRSRDSVTFIPASKTFLITHGSMG